MERFFLMNKDVKDLDEQERFKLIYQLDIDASVFEYVTQRLKNLSIEICGDHEGNVIELMCKGLLEGWCWQTTESSIVFFNDDDIKRASKFLEISPLIFINTRWIMPKKVFTVQATVP